MSRAKLKCGCDINLDEQCDCSPLRCNNLSCDSRAFLVWGNPDVLEQAEGRSCLILECVACKTAFKLCSVAWNGDYHDVALVDRVGNGDDQRQTA